MRKVLVITPYYAPHSGSLSVRISKITKYLGRSGWRPLALTTDSIPSDDLPVEIPPSDIFRTPFPEPLSLARGLASKIKSFFGAGKKTAVTAQPSSAPARNSFVRILRDVYWYLFCFPDKGIWWYPFAVTAGKKIIAAERPDAIFSVAGYFSAHLAARRLSKLSGLPFIASFDDPWEESYYFKRLRPVNAFEMKLKRFVVSAAAILAASTVAEAEILGREFKKEVLLLPHGFDEDEFPSAAMPRPPEKKFIIAHTGILHDLRRDPSELFGAVKNLKDSGFIGEDNFEIRFLGPDSDLAAAEANKYGIGGMVKSLGKVARNETLRAQRDSSALLLLGSMSTMRTCPLKLFEYFGARKPVLYLSRKDCDDAPSRIIEAAGAGYTLRNAAEIENVLRRWVEIFRGGGALSPVITEEARSGSTWQKTASALAAALDSLTASAPPESGRDAHDNL